MSAISRFLGHTHYLLGLIFKVVTLPMLLLGGSAALLIGFSKTGIPGVGMPAIAIMAEAFPVDNTKLAVGAMVPLLIVGDMFAVFYYRRHADWSRLAELVPYVLMGMIPGYLVLKYLQGDWLLALIGLIILGLLGVHLAREKFGWKEMPDRWWFVASTGFLAGFGTVVGNAAGPAMAVYFLAKKLNKHEFIGTAAWFFFIVNVSKIPFYWLYVGAITPTTLKLDLCVAPLVVVGALVGVAVHKRISQRRFNTLVLLLAALFALRMVGVGVVDIFGLNLTR
jgi:uncharacterized membrane protein YfcA